MANRVTHSYEYNALCDSCKFVYKASELRLRYDGMMVCKDDWEQRHPSDFYRPRNDVHKLPFTRPDEAADPEPVWSASPLGFISFSAATKEAPSTPTMYYHIDPLLGKTTGGGIAIQWTDSVDILITLQNPRSTTSTIGGTMTLPTTPTTAGRATFRTDNKVLGTSAITAGSASVIVPTWTAQAGNVLINFSYGT